MGIVLPQGPIYNAKMEHDINKSYIQDKPVIIIQWEYVKFSCQWKAMHVIQLSVDKIQNQSPFGFQIKKNIELYPDVSLW